MNPHKKNRARFEENAMFEIDNLLRLDDDQPPVEPVDDIRRKRDIISVLRTLKQQEPHGDLSRSGIEELDSGPFKSRAPALVIGLAVAAAAAVAFILLHPSATERASTLDSVAATQEQQPSPTVLSAQILLISGRLGASAADLALGKSLQQGDVIDVDRGQVVLAMGNRVKVLVQPNTRLELPGLSEDNIELSLIAGEVIVSVVPDKVPLRVAVATTHGRAVVKGTVFSVKAGDEVDVSVYRGAVQIEDTKHSSYAVHASEMSRLSVGSITGIPPEAEMHIRTVGRLLDFLGGPDQAMLEVRTMPPGASVSLDGELIGSAPIAVAVRSGYRELALQLAGHTAVVEHVALGRDEKVSRVFEMPSADHGREDAPIEKTGQIKKSARQNPTDKEMSAVDLLVQAQKTRNEGRWKESAKILGRLIDNYPRSNEAHTARVSLGIIQLKHLGQPAGALTNFDAYLKISSSGALAQEAVYGRANVFRALGDSRRETETLKDFILRYPSSIRAQEASQRLRSIEGKQ